MCVWQREQDAAGAGCVLNAVHGSSVSGQGVAAAMRDVVQEHGGMDPQAAAAYVKRLEATRRYSVEAWS